MKEIEQIDNYGSDLVDFFEVNQYVDIRQRALRAESSLRYGKGIEVPLLTATVIMWIVCMSLLAGYIFHPKGGFIAIGIFVLGFILSIPFAVFEILRRRHFIKPVEERRSPGERVMLADPFACYASAINEAVEALNADLVRWNAYVDAVDAGMQSVTSDDEGLYAVLVSRRETLIAHAKKFNFLCMNKSTKTKAIGFPELAAKVSEAEKEFSAVEPAVTAKVYREQILGPVSELEELRKSSRLTGLRVETAAQKAGVTEDAEQVADGDEFVAVADRAAAGR